MQTRKRDNRADDKERRNRRFFYPVGHFCTKNKPHKQMKAISTRLGLHDSSHKPRLRLERTAVDGVVEFQSRLATEQTWDLIYGIKKIFRMIVFPDFFRLIQLSSS